MILLAFLPIFAASMATAETREEYNARVVEAKTKLSVAQESLQKAILAYNSALQASAELEQQVIVAQQNLNIAQVAYDQSQIPDSSWIRPTKQITISEEVPYTVQIENTEMVTQTILVPREVSTIIPSGLIAKSYNMQGYNNRPPLPTEDRLVATQTVDNIDFQWGGGMILNSGLYEDVIVKFTGSIYIPETGTYTFYAPGDDGVQAIIDTTQIINDWYDKGGGGSTVTANLTAGVHSFTLWFYENGGGANVWLYWTTPNNSMAIVPPSAFGQQVETTTVYDEVTTTTEVVTVTEEIRYKTETHLETVTDENAVQPMIKDQTLIPAIMIAQATLDAAIAKRDETLVVVETLNSAVEAEKAAVDKAQDSLDRIGLYVEPEITPEPEVIPEEPQPEILIENLSKIKPENLTDNQIAELVLAANAVFETAEQGSKEYNQALEALAVAAEADDPELPAELAAIPGAAQVLEVFNNLGNVGADMSPKIREEAEKTVIASVIAAGAAVQAVAATTSVSSSGGGTSRRNN